MTKFLEGNPNTALVEPSSIVMNRTTAEKYFGKNAAAVGKTLHTMYDLYKVTGVFEDIPENTHIRYNMLISMSSDSNNYNQNWGYFNYFTYALLKPGSSREAFQKKVDQTEEKYVKPGFDPFGVKMRFYEQPIVDIHLLSDLEREPEIGKYVIYMDFFRRGVFYAAHRLYQLYESYHGQVGAKGKRNRHPESYRFGKGATHRTVFGGINIYGDGRRSAQFPIHRIIISRFQFDLRKIVFHYDPVTALQYFPDDRHWFIYRPHWWQLSCFLFVGIPTGKHFKRCPVISVWKYQSSQDACCIAIPISMVMLICTWIVYSQLEYMRNKDLGFDKNQVMTVVVNTGKFEPENHCDG